MSMAASIDGGFEFVGESIGVDAPDTSFATIELLGRAVLSEALRRAREEMVATQLAAALSDWAEGRA